VNPIQLPYGGEEPLLIEPAPGTEVTVCEGPEGCVAAVAEELVKTALAATGRWWRWPAWFPR
jgi:hypothetical protein